MLAFFLVSIRFEVRGGFRPEAHPGLGAVGRFQSALRFAVVSDRMEKSGPAGTVVPFQSALRFAVVSDFTHDKDNRFANVSIRFEVRGGFRRKRPSYRRSGTRVSIRFEVRGGFRRRPFHGRWRSAGFNPL